MSFAAALHAALGQPLHLPQHSIKRWGSVERTLAMED